MKATILATCTGIAILGLQPANAANNCAEDIAAVDEVLTKLGAPATPKNPRDKQLMVARKLLNEAKEARDSGKEERCQKKVAAARRNIPK